MKTFVSSFFLKDQDPKTESGFSPKNMQIRCKPAGLEYQGPKPESGFSPKIMQIRCKPGGLEDKDAKTESGLGPKIMQKHSKPGSLKDQDPKKVRFPKLILHCGSEAFVDIRLTLFFEGSGSAN